MQWDNLCNLVPLAARRARNLLSLEYNGLYISILYVIKSVVFNVVRRSNKWVLMRMKQMLSLRCHISMLCMVCICGPLSPLPIPRPSRAYLAPRPLSLMITVLTSIGLMESVLERLSGMENRVKWSCEARYFVSTLNVLHMNYLLSSHINCYFPIRFWWHRAQSVNSVIALRWKKLFAVIYPPKCCKHVSPASDWRCGVVCNGKLKPSLWLPGLRVFAPTESCIVL